MLFIARAVKSSRWRWTGHVARMEELHNDFYSSHNIERVIKSSRLRWTGHVARMEELHAVHSEGY